MDEETLTLLALVCELSKGVEVECNTDGKWYLEKEDGTRDDTPTEMIGIIAEFRQSVPDVILRMEYLGDWQLPDDWRQPDDLNAFEAHLVELHGLGLIISSEKPLTGLQRGVNRYTSRDGTEWRIEFDGEDFSVYCGDSPDCKFWARKIMPWYAATVAGWRYVHDAEQEVGVGDDGPAEQMNKGDDRESARISASADNRIVLQVLFDNKDDRFKVEEVARLLEPPNHARNISWVNKQLDELESYGLADTPSGPRSGFQITRRGLEFLSNK